MIACLVLAAALAAEPIPAQVELLKTFRSEFIEITPGEGKFPRSFVMGSDSSEAAEKPAHQVTFGYRFAIARYEVPQNLWEAVTGDNPSKWKGPRNSVEMLSRSDAAAFCRQATELMRSAGLIGKDQLVRLPSEAEWEYCARAGSTTKFSWGDDVATINDYAWYTGNAKGNDPPVGAKKPNAWGLYDVHGYLWEWCLDAWHDDYVDAPDSGAEWSVKEPAPAEYVVRGGSWKDKAEQLASSFRQGLAADTRDDAVGLRCVLAGVRPSVVAAGAPGEAQPAEFKPTAQAEVFPADAKLELLWGEGEFTEGPALAPDGSILFSDIGNAIYRYDPATAKTAIFRQPSGRSNGLMFDQQGRLIACEGANTGGNRRISVTKGINKEKDGVTHTLTDKFMGKMFNSPNDLAIDPAGNIYFSDPRYVGDEPRQLDFEGVFRVTPSGATTIATRDVQKPNGILVSADGKRVFVSDNNAEGNRQLVVFNVKADGSLDGKKVLHDFRAGRGIDGMTLDTDGNIYATAGTGELAGIHVFSSEGKHLAFLATPGDPTNCTFGGGADSGTLYITAATGPTIDGKQPHFGLFRIKTGKRGYYVVQLAKE
ncbi:MAG TPA: SMP-30/gluconolactonase/LRE family protein [Pirellulaceae bacterium]|nr:SMP-30/gluconolactonase/LRE family protein [Pirellulaceae bacterium]